MAPRGSLYTGQSPGGKTAGYDQDRHDKAFYCRDLMRRSPSRSAGRGIRRETRHAGHNKSSLHRPADSADRSRRSCTGKVKPVFHPLAAIDAEFGGPWRDRGRWTGPPSRLAGTLPTVSRDPRRIEHHRTPGPPSRTAALQPLYIDREGKRIIGPLPLPPYQKDDGTDRRICPGRHGRYKGPAFSKAGRSRPSRRASAEA